MKEKKDFLTMDHIQTPMVVYNKKGDAREIIIRFARPDEASQMITLLKKQHGSCYYQKMYEENYVRKLIEDKVLQVALVETAEGVLMGMTGAIEKDFPGTITFTMLMIKPKMRGFGLGKTMQVFLRDAIPFDGFASIYTHCMTLDTITQKNQIEFGYRMTGLLLNCSIYDLNSPPEYLAGVSLPFKDTLIVACLPCSKQDAGILYAPLSHAAYIEEVYISLGVACKTGKGGENEAAPVQSNYSIHQDERQRYCEVFIREAAQDIDNILDEILRQYAAQEHQTFNVFVNLNDPACPYVCCILEKRGFFFTGLQPLSGNYEYMILHYSPSIQVPFDKIAVVPEFNKQFLLIQKLYKEAYYGKTN
jgi:hypothetical protein